MLKAKVLAALNKQIAHEFSNAHSYQAVSLYFAGLNLHGLEAFMAKQVSDEREHAHKFIAHVVDRGGKVELEAIPAPKINFKSPLEAARHVAELEKATTGTIHKLFELAEQDKDAALQVCLHWFINEQVEEEQWSTELLELMTQFSEHPGQLFMLDHQWGKRVKAD